MGSNLLYVSDDSTFDVCVFAYPAGTLAGTLTGFNQPSGECVDPKRHAIFITNMDASDILAYKYGATSPFETISDPGE